MKFFVVLTALALATGSPVFAEGPAKSKSKLNTNIYEQEKTEKTFSASVKMVREASGGWEIMFDGQAGIFNLAENNEAHLSALVESQKSKKAVSVKVNTETNTILSARGAPGAANPAPAEPAVQNPRGR